MEKTSKTFYRKVIGVLSSEKKTLSNIFYLAITQIIHISLPLITLPYLIRILGVEKFGLISFSQGFITYFVVFADYGFPLSATRSVALVKNDECKLSKLFYAVMYAKLLLFAIAFIIFSVIVLTIHRFSQDVFIYFSTFGIVLGSVLIPSWFFQGIEKMSFIAVINAAIKLITAVAIFTLIRVEADYKLLTVIYSLGYILPGFIALIYAIKTVRIRVRPSWNDIRNELYEGWHFFTSNIYLTILSSSSVVILGLVTNNVMVGYYAPIDRIAKVLSSSLSPIYNAIFPKISVQLATNKAKDRRISLIMKYIWPTMILAFLIAFITWLLFKPVIIPFLGKPYIKYEPILIILLGWFLLSTLNGFIGRVYLSALGKSKLYSQALLFSGSLSLILSYMLSIKYNGTGTAIAITISEFVLTLYIIIYLYIRRVK